MTPTVVVLAAVVGACVGSFLNVVIHRVPRGESIVRPASRCPACGSEVAVRDNVPIASWLILRGRCRTCRAPISVRYLVIEATVAVLWVAAVLRFESLADAALVSLSGSVLLALSAIDLQHRRLPNAIVLPATSLAVLWAVIAAIVSGNTDQLVASLASGAAAFTLFLLIALVSGGMGMGDVKLAAFIGVVTGWFSPAVTASAVFFGFFIGGIVSIGLLIAGRAKRKSAIPFGPALAAGAIVGLFVGAGPVRSYLGL